MFGKGTEVCCAMSATASSGCIGCSDLKSSAATRPIATITDRDVEALAEDG